MIIWYFQYLLILISDVSFVLGRTGLPELFVCYSGGCYLLLSQQGDVREHLWFELTDMSSSIRQKITLFTLIPAIFFYSFISVAFLYFSFRYASLEVGRRHLDRSLYYAAVIDGHLREMVAGSNALADSLRYDQTEPLRDIALMLPSFFAGNMVVEGVGIIFQPPDKQPHYWINTLNGVVEAEGVHKQASDIPEEITRHLFSSHSPSGQWFTSTEVVDASVFRSSLLVPVILFGGEKIILRIDIDGSKLISPFHWSDSNSRLIIFDQNGVAVFANGITIPKYRDLDKFIELGPCQAYSQINITGKELTGIHQPFSSSLRPNPKETGCDIFRELFSRVTLLSQSVNLRMKSRNTKRWISATPIPSTNWYFSISIREKDMLAPVVKQVILSASLISVALLLTLLGLWMVSGRITRPLNRLKQQMNTYAASSGLSEINDSKDEAESLTRSFFSLTERLAEREKELFKTRVNNLGHLIEQLRGGYFYFNLNTRGEITYVSNSVRNVLGYTPDSFRGAIQNYLTGASNNKDFGEKLRDLVNGKWLAPFEVEIRHGNGGVSRVELFCSCNRESPEADYVIEGLGNDITRRINDTEKFRALIASSPDAMVVTNQDGMICMVNRRIPILFGYKQHKLINMPLTLLIAPKARKQNPLLVPLNLGDQKRHCLDNFLSTGIDSHGQEFPMELSSNVLNTSDGVQVCIILRDISNRKKIQEELIESKNRAEQASRTKSLFLSNISHELRTPLNGVLGYTQLLLKQDVPEKHREMLQSLEECGLHLMMLINDILDMTKIESSGVSIISEAFDLETTLNMVMANIRASAKQKQLELRMNVAGDVAREIVGDNLKLRQVLINLTGNAVKFTHRGCIELKVYRQDEQLFFSVTDTGLGIAVKDQEGLFKPFSQLKSGQKLGGTGLGLAICYRLVKAMGGQLVVESQPGEGSCFSFSIPYEESEGSAPLPEKSLSQTLPELNDENKNYSILVVDDSENNRNLLTSALQSYQFKVDSAENGQIALEKNRAYHFDLILMDLKMPVMDGFAATREIRKMSKDEPVIILAVSAIVSEETRQRIEGSGFDDFIAKPLSFSELFEKIYQSLGITGCHSKEGTALQPELTPESAGTIHDQIVSSLEMGDLEGLEKRARQWQKQPAFRHYPEQIIKCCQEINVEQLEAIRQELVNSR